jgi:hypothetical protein
MHSPLPQSPSLCIYRPIAPSLTHALVAPLTEAAAAATPRSLMGQLGHMGSNAHEAASTENISSRQEYRADATLPGQRARTHFHAGLTASSLGTSPRENGRSVDGYGAEAGRKIDGTSVENGRKMGGEWAETGRTWTTHGLCNGIWTERGRNIYRTYAGHGRDIDGRWTDVENT